MQLQGVKHLPKLNHFTEEAYDQLIKKQQEYRKYTRGTYDRFEQIIKGNESFCLAFEKCFPSCLAEEGQVQLLHLEYYLGISQTLQRMLTNHRQFGRRIVKLYQQGSNDFATGQAKEGELLLQLQKKVKFYRGSELSLIQAHKRFYKLYKALITSTDLYKQAFTDVRLIYNKGQKIRRYTNCEQVYRDIMNDYHLISELVKQMTKQKQQMRDIFNSFIVCSRANIKNAGDKIKIMSVGYVQACFDMQSQIMATFNNSIDTIVPLVLEFNLLTPYLLNQQRKYLDESLEIQVHPFIPSVILNFKHIKETHYPHISIFLIHLEKQLLEVSKKRKNINRQLYEMIINFQRAYERYHSSLREFVIKYEKRKKKSQQFYGDHPCIFMNTFSKVLEICIEASEKVSKQTTLKAKLIEQSLLEESKILDGLFKEYKLIIERLFSKKDTKRISFEKNQSQSKREEIMKVENERLKAETILKLEHLKTLFQQTYQKIKKNSLEIKLQYDSILQLMEKISIEKFATIKEQIELGSQFALHKDDLQYITQAIISKTHFYEQSAFGVILGDENKICFEADLNKIQEFTKLKKPVELENKNEKQVEQDLISTQKEKQEQLKPPGEQTTENESVLKNLPECESALNEVGGGEKVENASKHEAFLLTKIAFGPQEKYCKSYVCGLADKIILSGRLYITNQRLCFFSKFNPKNVFFGYTFLDIPKKDIKKIEKRSNAVIFDNSISITTVNGQIFFTSFFSRNEAFDMICSAMQISLDEFMYVEEKIEEPIHEEAIIQQQDDIKDMQILEREQKLKSIMDQSQHFDYKPVLHTQFSGDGLNALKFLKIFELNSQITYQRGKYRGFSQFFKQLIGHTENSIEDWTPNLQDYLNSGNIKQGAPMTYTKKFISMVPVANSGIPFMPKTSKIVESFTLHLISKDKYVIFTTCKSHGVPYCDDFLIHYRREVESVSEGRLSYKVDFYNHFYTNTMMKGIIISKSFDQSKVSFKRLEEEMRKYLKHLQKNKLSQSRIENENENQGMAACSSLREENEQLASQLQQLKKEQETFRKQIEAQRLKTSKARVLLLSSVVLNALLLLYLLFCSRGHDQSMNDIN